MKIFVLCFIFVVTLYFANKELGDLQRKYDEFRAEATRVNAENICFRMLYGPYTPHDQMIDDCARYGVDITQP